MSQCSKNQEILDAHIVGAGSLDELDFSHAERCRRCQIALEKADRLKLLLEGYALAEDRQASNLLDEDSDAAAQIATALGAQERRSSNRIAIGLVAAIFCTLALSVLIRMNAPGPSLTQQRFLASLEQELMRGDLNSYLARSQTFLNSLLGANYLCADGKLQIGAEKALAKKLLYQKRLLEPQLRGVAHEDLGSMLDDFEFVLIQVAGSDDCVEAEELMMWRDVLEKRATLVKLNLLQMKGRI